MYSCALSENYLFTIVYVSFCNSHVTQGYIQRRLMKAMEGIVVSYDGTVRNSNRHLVQLSYGEDGMDGAFMEFQQLPGIKPSDSAFKRRFYFDCSDQRYIPVHVYMCNLVPLSCFCVCYHVCNVCLVVLLYIITEC